MAYSKGDKIRVAFIARVTSPDTGFGGTAEVAELLSDARGYIHYLAADSTSARIATFAEYNGSNLRKGEQIRVSFEAVVDADRADTETALNLTRVRGPGGYIHYLCLDSPLITLVEAAESTESTSKNEGKIMPYKQGDQIRLECEAQVLSVAGSANGTSRVRELVDGKPIGYTHYLYLGSPNGRRQVLKDWEETGSAPEVGTLVTVSLGAVVDGKLERGESLTTAVRGVDIEPGALPGATRFTHYVFLSSRAVRSATEPPVQETTVRYAKGTELRVEFDAEVLTFGGEANATSAVREILPDGSPGYTHYLYLAERARPEILVGYDEDGLEGYYAPVGTKIKVAFTAVVDDSEPNAILKNTCQVRSPQGERADGNYFFHYLFLGSDAIRPVEAATKAASPTVTLRISNRNTTIEDGDVIDAIEEIESALISWTVQRDSNSEVLAGPFETEEEADTWIDANDYNPARVSAVEDEGEASEELVKLRELARLAENYIDDWGGGVTILRADQINEGYAKDEFRDRLSGYVDLDEWPYCYIDWDKAASSLADDKQSFTWDGETWYSA